MSDLVENQEDRLSRVMAHLCLICLLSPNIQSEVRKLESFSGYLVDLYITHRKDKNSAEVDIAPASGKVNRP